MVLGLLLGLQLLGAGAVLGLEPGRPQPPALGDTVARPHLDRSVGSAAELQPLPYAETSAALLTASELTIPPHSRVLVFAPHPDDETIAAGGLIQQALASGGSVRVVFVTNGDGYVDAVKAAVHSASASSADFLAFGERRHQEAVTALRQLGVDAEESRFLGFPDDGIDDLWSGHWSDRRPYTSPHTRFSRPPYPESARPDVEYAGVDLESEIRHLLQEWQPTLVVTPDPRDSHPDHCTTGVFVLDALRRLRASQPRGVQPLVLGYLVHAPDYPASARWVSNVSRAGVGGSPTARYILERAAWERLPLNSTQQEAKTRALSAYGTQLQVMRPFLVQFLRDFELFSRLDDSQIVRVPREYAARFGRTPQP